METYTEFMDRKLNIVKMSVLPKFIPRFNKFPIESQQAFL